jgi:hypothetical protein
VIRRRPIEQIVMLQTSNPLLDSVRHQQRRGQAHPQ